MSVKMLRIAILFISAILTLSCADEPAPAGAVNLESVDAFFVFADKMRAGEAIGESDWDKLFSTPGYGILTAHFGEDLMKDAITLGLDPSRRQERNRRLATPLTEEDMMKREVVIPWFMAQNFAEMEGKWDELKEFRRTFDFNGLEPAATAALRDYLIDPVDSLIEFPSMAYVCMDKNARSLGTGIVMDLNLASENSFDMTIREMAHEMFHTYRSKLMNVDFIYSSDLIWALALVQNEGMADQLDKAPYEIPTDPDALTAGERMYHEAYINTDSILARLDAAANSFLDGTMSEEEFDEFTDNIFIFDGHPNGFYMTSMIRRAGLVAEMVEQPANPVAFARVYNKAAEKEGAFVFSPRVMEYLESLEREYL